MRTTLEVAATGLAFGAGHSGPARETANQVARIDPVTGDRDKRSRSGTARPGSHSEAPAPGWRTASTGPSHVSTPRRTRSSRSLRSETVPRRSPPTRTASGSTISSTATSCDSTRGRTPWLGASASGTRSRRRDLRRDAARERRRVGHRSSRRHADGARTPRSSIRSTRPWLAARPAWQLLRMTNDGLVAYNQTSGLAGTQLVPDLAVSLPTPTDGGKT